MNDQMNAHLTIQYSRCKLLSVDLQVAPVGHLKVNISIVVNFQNNLLCSKSTKITSYNQIFARLLQQTSLHFYFLS